MIDRPQRKFFLQKSGKRPATMARPNSISKISVYNLFGRYSYDNLEFGAGGEDVAILYGDNGAGKTTLMNLIYSSLSPITDEGNRTKLSRAPFSNLKITLVDGSEIEVIKEEGLIGSYSFRINDYILPIKASRSGGVRADENPRVDSIEEKLQSLSLDILYLHDDRTIQSTYELFRGRHRAVSRHRLSDSVVFRSGSDWEVISDFVDPAYAEPAWVKARSRDVEDPLGLSEIISAVSEWLSKKARQGTSSGDEDASNVYLNVLRALSSRGERNPDGAVRDTLLKSLVDLDSEVKKYQRFGLVGVYPLKQFCEIVSDVSDDRFQDVSAVLTPYIDAVITRLNAIEEVRLLMESFEDELDSYLRDKEVSLHVDEEMRVSGLGNSRIPVAGLSSGERQLFFLFCAALLSRDGNSVFMIDEPELSLNIKWQRRLVSSLAKLARGASTQFVFATHSIEVMAQHRNSIIYLR